jgi:glycosyltransferase involved in cell wall biosynthesis
MKKNYHEIETIRVSDLFNSGFYLRNNADVRASGMDPVVHYVKFGSNEGRDPGPGFSTMSYLQANPDVQDSVYSALGHYELFGRQEHRHLFKETTLTNLDVTPAPEAPLESKDEIVAVRASDLFDSIFYLERNADVRALDMDPATHYVKFGSIEGRDPGPGFSTLSYLQANPDVQGSIYSALGHYELFGRQENRRLFIYPRPANRDKIGAYLTCHPDLEGEDHPTLDVTVSVVIPTYNAGSEFILLLRKLRNQKGLRSIEIVTVDSESRDGTPQVAARYDCVIIPIKQSDFSHSYSRNLGAAAASGDYILFMVQDAYPIGDHWIYGMVRCLIDNRHGRGLAALSCAEYPRSDSELFYDALLKGHYDFIGCSDSDRLGKYIDDDHMSLRMQGQLSDVACLVPKPLFDKYKYHGDYAEDLTFGIKLIRDGYRVGMLSSIRVVHSHNRPTQYYLRRSFVDVIFLAEIFSDFKAPKDTDLEGTLAAAALLAQLAPQIVADRLCSPIDIFTNLLNNVRRIEPPQTLNASWDGCGLASLHPWLESFYERPDRPASLVSSKSFIESFKQTQAIYADRLNSLMLAITPYPVLDEIVAHEISDAINKSLAMTIGAQLAFCYVAPLPNQKINDLHDRLVALRKILASGI